MMAKRKKESKEVLAKKRERERLRYQTIKNNPDLYKKNNNIKYERRKAQKKIICINEMTTHQQKMQRQKWREEGKRRYQRIKDRKGKERQLTMENSPRNPQERGIESVLLVEVSEGKKNEIVNFDIIFIPELVNDAVVKTEPFCESIDSCHTTRDAVIVKDKLLCKENMAKPKPKRKQELLVNKRERERQRYQKIKNDPELYAEYQRNNNMKYEKRKVQKKIVHINEMTSRQQKLQRKKWREEGKRRYQRVKDRKEKERQLITENSPHDGIVTVQLDTPEGLECVIVKDTSCDGTGSCDATYDDIVKAELCEESMSKPKSKTKVELLAIKRERERLRYQKIKHNPELFAEYQRNNNIKYEKRKVQKKIVLINEMTTRQQKMQRKKWREEGRRRYQRIKDTKGKDKQLISENIPHDSIVTVQLDAPEGLECVIVKETSCDGTGSCDATYDDVVKAELCEESTSKPKSKTKEELLAIKRERERLRYQQIKNNPKLFAEYQRNNNIKYEKRKVQKKIVLINEMTTRQQKMQRKKWREEGRRRYQRIKDTKGKDKQLISENIPHDSIVTVQLDAPEGLECVIVKETSCDGTGSCDATYDDVVKAELCEESMSKPKSKTKEELLAIKRERERLRYQKIKHNPELFAEYQRNNNIKYEKRKVQKKIVLINEMTTRQQKMQRKKWREEGKRRYQRIKDRKGKDKQLISENIPHDGIVTVQLDAPEGLENVIVKETFCDGTGSNDATYDAVVKEEPLCEDTGCASDDAVVKDTGSCDAAYDALVKKEVLREDTGSSAATYDAVVKDTGSCASDDALTKLYEDHEVKDEVVLGPECLQRPVASAVPHVNEEISSAPGQPTQPQGGQKSSPTSNNHKPKASHQSKKHPCATCAKEFKRAYHLKSHMLTHTGSKPYTCDVCKKDFTFISNLKSHKRVHTGEKPFSCELCKMRFANSGSLKVHKRIHAGLKPYCCDICHKAFRVTDSLKRHKRSHTGEKPYLCEICKKGFKDSGDLKKHKRTHSGEKPYSCDICNKKFAQLSNLRKHKRIHTGEKPYDCNICEKKFSQLINLKKHENIHTRDDPLSC